jgi:hypothetical protein
MVMWCICGVFGVCDVCIVYLWCMWRDLDVDKLLKG